MKSVSLRSMLAGLVLVAITLFIAGDAAAQCSTCASPTVAYQPVIAQPAVAYQPYTGWYPGKWLDQWRLRRASLASTPAYTASYSPTASPYTAGYSPYASTYAAAYRPYVSSFAPLSAPAVAPCNSCTQTAYYPAAQTLARQVLLRPVVAAQACNTCSYTPSCGCDACSTGVSQATYNEPYSQPYAEPGCSSCGGGGSVVTNVVPDGYAPGGYTSPNIGPQTPQPNLSAEPAPESSRYERRNRPVIKADDSHSHAHGHDHDHHEHSHEDDASSDDVDPLEKFDPRPEAEADSSTYYNAPRLFDPRDRTAARSYQKSRKPTADVWTAVYRGPTKHRQASTRVRKQAAPRSSRSQAEIDAEGWTAVPRSR